MKLQRIQKIEEYIKQHGSLSLDELCREFEVSKNTIRRDIQELEARQIVNKVYGGVTFNAKDALIPLAQRQITLKAEKMRIAAKAAELAQDGDILVIDAGSTTAHTVDYLSRRKHLTVITNSVPVLNAQCQVVMHPFEVKTLKLSADGKTLEECGIFGECKIFLIKYII